MKDYEIQWLNDHPDLAEATAQLLLDVWPDHYGEGGPGDAHKTTLDACVAEGLPLICVVVVFGGQVVATGALQETSIPSHKHLSPWLGGLATSPDFRRQGIGEAMIGAIEEKARELSIGTLYCATHNAIGIVERRGWKRIDEELENGTLYGIYVKHL